MFRVDDGTDLAERLARPASRRAALRCLAGLGLAAGVPALGPDLAAARPKRQRSRREHDGAAGRAYPGDVGGEKPTEADPGDQPDVSWFPSARLSVKRWRRGWMVRVEAENDFSDADLTAMRQGKQCRLSCEIWENDDNEVRSINPNTDTFVFAFAGRTIPSGSSKRGPIVFEKWASKNTLDLDTPNPDADEIIGLLILTTTSGQVITQPTNMVRVIRY